MTTESSNWTGSAIQNFNSLAHRISHSLHLDGDDITTPRSPSGKKASTGDTPKSSPAPASPTSSSSPAARPNERPRSQSMPYIIKREETNRSSPLPGVVAQVNPDSPNISIVRTARTVNPPEDVSDFSVWQFPRQFMFKKQEGEKKPEIPFPGV